MVAGAGAGAGAGLPDLLLPPQPTKTAMVRIETAKERRVLPRTVLTCEGMVTLSRGSNKPLKTQFKASIDTDLQETAV